ncbi:hypothetical protein GCM10025867_30080 [Frondihabitans sucicola]|uniref:Polymerase nucleotidyl transferase domain-containing protein n=1 Tax=Frondihabitans sucicola TaxID=1268041 RepID=A0ABM8GR46_9MICO|nr:hypothetical protein GCM10025867_30080 [Frondihabitans sucicola]
MPSSDHTFDPFSVDVVADTLFGLPGVEAVALGGSRAEGVNRPDSDWDIAIYYRSGFDPESVRGIGWPGHLSDLGGWGRVFNGGGKVTVGDQLIDIHYRDLGLVDEIHDTAVRGEFTIEPLLFHQAGLPSYILLAELGINQTLRGALPCWDYPAVLQKTAPLIWWDHSRHTLDYADSHARHGRVAQCAGLLSEAACHAAHAILAHRGVWVTNEKRLLDTAGLRGLDDVIMRLGSARGSLERAAADTRELLVATGTREGMSWR